MRKTIRRWIDKIQNNLTLDIGSMSSDLIAVYRTFESLDRSEPHNLDALPSCGRMYHNWLNKYVAVTDADLDSKAALCTMFVKMLSRLRYGYWYVTMVNIGVLEK